MVFCMREAAADDWGFWRSLDGHINHGEWLLKLEEGRCLLICDGQTPVGVFRYGLFWDNLPFLNLISLWPEYRHKGFGQGAMKQWEEEMREQGFPAVMTSTQADEDAQHFYRKLGYKDTGCLFLDLEGIAQPAELFFVKAL